MKATIINRLLKFKVTATVGLLLAFVYPLYGQEVEEKKEVWRIKGYIKELPYISFDKNFSNVYATNIIHNRLNIKWTPSQKITGAAEFRTRLFWGDDVRSTPNFSEQMRNRNEQVDASITWFETDNAAMITNIERFWLEYKASRWALRAGRQRINWGIATTWNPNDIFNAYNFLDFDYEERPGSDAVKYQYFINDLSNVDVAVSPSFSNNTSVAAARYFFNKGTYDWQVSMGWYHRDFTLGAGWAGSIDDVGFKGEMQYFAPNDQSSSQFNAVVEWDYMFAKGWYINGSFLWNNQGLTAPVDDWTTVSFNLSPRNLMPTAYNVLLSTTKEITPLLSANLGLVYTPGTHIAIVLPSLQYNLSDRWDVNLVWQSFYADMNDSFQAVTYRIFFRAKWSF
jgi:hypothetical protein